MHKENTSDVADDTWIGALLRSCPIGPYVPSTEGVWEEACKVVAVGVTDGITVGEIEEDAALDIVQDTEDVDNDVWDDVCVFDAMRDEEWDTVADRVTEDVLVADKEGEDDADDVGEDVAEGVAANRGSDLDAVGWKRNVSDGVKTVETGRCENHWAQKLNGSSIRPELVGWPNEFWSTLVSLWRIRLPLEEGRNAGNHPERKWIRGSGKTVDFKPATFRGFWNVAEREDRRWI